MDTNYQPTKLQAHELEDPFAVMDYFFLGIYKGWAHNSSQYANEQIIKDMLCFYTQFSEFLDSILKEINIGG